MNRYELVVLIDPKMKKEDTQKFIGEIEEMLWKTIAEKDEIWMLDLVYTIKWYDTAYFLSIYFESDPSLVSDLNQKLRLKKKILRFFVYKLRPEEKYLKYHEVNKMFEESEEERKKQENEKAFKELDSVQK